MIRLIAPHPTERRPFPWKRVAVTSAQLALAGGALGSAIVGRFDVAALHVGTLCYVELRKWGRT